MTQASICLVFEREPTKENQGCDMCGKPPLNDPFLKHPLVNHDLMTHKKGGGDLVHKITLGSDCDFLEIH